MCLVVMILQMANTVIQTPIDSLTVSEDESERKLQEGTILKQQFEFLARFLAI